jgi:tetratricopeptide (TPR) repeat protein
MERMDCLTLARAYSDRGNAYLCKGEYDKAGADCSEAIRLNPTDATAYANRGTAYLCKGEYDKAIANSTEAIRLDPTLAWAHADLVVAYGAQRGSRPRQGGSRPSG